MSNQSNIHEMLPFRGKAASHQHGAATTTTTTMAFRPAATAAATSAAMPASAEEEDDLASLEAMLRTTEEEMAEEEERRERAAAQVEEDRPRAATLKKLAFGGHFREPVGDLALRVFRRECEAMAEHLPRAGDDALRRKHERREEHAVRTREMEREMLARAAKLDGEKRGAARKGKKNKKQKAAAKRVIAAQKCCRTSDQLPVDTFGAPLNRLLDWKYSGPFYAPNLSYCTYLIDYATPAISSPANATCTCCSMTFATDLKLLHQITIAHLKELIDRAATKTGDDSQEHGKDDAYTGRKSDTSDDWVEPNM
ncbi:uncharacterized protein MYCGRDRAFT_94716 [Zymoseptoria tritici IPO323]|uniref:Uncharacterized protein n=1 Tax=Zymoseptoria tritici (strain CBS 115943 / IPO323) TaxID=336722 RepID=F9XET2_ZYMTI|nr:uncharacterized protein MYCGRDRAFT_94716 [Zymoseptoria tritici IPO323]EGP85974.1 hypothetical protein MYCGRDRAFT_94716 [Zymoseptoria tritici IPO323]